MFVVKIARQAINQAGLQHEPPVRTNGDINKISLACHDPDEGWGHGVLFGTDMDRGWTLECDMQDGKLISAFTPAGQDPIFLMQATPTSSEEYHGTVVRIQVECDDVTWDADTRTLIIRATHDE